LDIGRFVESLHLGAFWVLPPFDLNLFFAKW